VWACSLKYQLEKSLCRYKISTRDFFLAYINKNSYSKISTRDFILAHKHPPAMFSVIMPYLLLLMNYLVAIYLLRHLGKELEIKHDQRRGERKLREYNLEF
jgi:hypothetical protein